MLILTARKHFVGVLSLFWVASFAVTVLPELQRIYQDILLGRAAADPLASATGVIILGLALGLGPPALLVALEAWTLRRRQIGVKNAALAPAEGRRRSDAIEL